MLEGRRAAQRSREDVDREWNLLQLYIYVCVCVRACVGLYEVLSLLSYLTSLKFLKTSSAGE